MSIGTVKKKAIHAPQVLNEPIQYLKPGSFSRGISLDLDNHTLLFISGTASVNKNGKTVYPGNFTAQAKRTFKNLTALLNSEGAGWKDVVRTTCYLAGMCNYDTFNKVRNQFYAHYKLDPLPASTCVEARLCRQDLLVEIELIAVIKKVK
ncbi:MAG: RidA family protein [Candidatus Omnitrophota bacterium]|nr:RidA family protein [Candidatus Omnitrophota bacterium]MBU1928679.1 RidA family protein [Candidatus Omnitrophota bacterium]MBU2035756.1 RidA family protein [Candidatus Omnitrophota bacterium]MBU2221373.1 RidA family protein [Candidatus Omnitrophota bacterium]MBU2258521.1 RidA family protein [Candidatus Omnitrophota bacterium]